MEIKKSKNQSAFPLEYEQFSNGCSYKEQEFGMSLRDYFANSAMQGIISSLTNTGLSINENHIKIVSKKSYMYSDAMLEEREKN